MNSQIRKLCAKFGYCCPWKMMVPMARRSSLKIAIAFGVTPRTARNWKRWHATGVFKCEKAIVGCGNCQRYKAKAPLLDAEYSRTIARNEKK